MEVHIYENNAWYNRERYVSARPSEAREQTIGFYKEGLNAMYVVIINNLLRNKVTRI